MTMVMPQLLTITVQNPFITNAFSVNETDLNEGIQSSNEYDAWITRIIRISGSSLTFLDQRLTTSLEPLLPHTSLVSIKPLWANQLSEQLLNFSDRRIRPTHQRPSITFIAVSTTEPPEGFISRISKLMDIRLNEDIYFVSEGLNSIEIWEAYRVKDRGITGNVITISLGQFKRGVDDWTQIWTWLIQYHLLPKVARRSDFKGAQLVTIVSKGNRTPFPRKVFQREDPNLELTTSFIADTYLDLKTLLNFRGKVVVGTSDMLTRTWDNESVVDFTSFFITNALERAKIYTLLQPIMDAKFEAFFQKPSINSVRNAHIYPFKLSVWISLFGTWVFVALTALAIHQAIQNMFEMEDFGEDYNPRLEILWWITTLIFMKSCHIPPSSNPLRCAFLTGGFLGLITYMSYSAVILSSISVPTSHIRVFEDLIGFKYTFTIHEKSTLMRVVLQELIDKHNLPQKVIDVDATHEIIHLLDDRQPMSIITYTDLFYREALLQNYSIGFICNMAHIPVVKRPFLSSLALRKGSEFTECFNYRIITMMERGFLKRYFRDYDFQGVMCQSQRNVEAGPIALKDAVLPFTMLGLGLMICLVLGLLEILKDKMDLSTWCGLGF